VGPGFSVLQQAGRPAARADGATKRPQFLATAGSSAKGSAGDSQDWRAKQVGEWLFLLLRFAITRDPDDALAVLMMANGIDSLGRQWGRAAPTFFRRSSDEICTAITALDDPKREAILKRYIQRIEHLPMRRAFEAAVHSEEKPPQSPGRSNQPDLWAGLRR
jgi:hypothetical protein